MLGLITEKNEEKAGGLTAGRRAAWILLLVVLAGCGRSPAEVAQEPPQAALRVVDFFPAQPGMVWRYEGRGNEFARYTAEVTHRLEDRAQIVHTSGARVARVYKLTDDRVTLLLQRAEVEEGDVYLEGEAEAPRIILQGPLVEGAEWEASPFIAGENAEDGVDRSRPREVRRIEGVGVTVITPAGRFDNALRVRVSFEGQTGMIEHYAPGVGLIRREFLSEEPIVSELEEFVIAAPK